LWITDFSFLSHFQEKKQYPIACLASHKKIRPGQVSDMPQRVFFTAYFSKYDFFLLPNKKISLFYLSFPYSL